MDFGSLRRKASERTKEHRKKTFSISNISFTSGNSSTTTTSVVRKSLNIALPKDLGMQQDMDGRVVKMSRGGSAHLSSVIQLGDLVNVFPNELGHPAMDDCPLTCHADDDFVNVNIIYGVLHCDSRPLCPLIVEVGNSCNTSLGLALADSPGEKIRVSSIQPGSLAERCGYLKPGDILISIQIREDETISCSPYYTSLETAQIIRRITSSQPSVILTILPYEAEQQLKAQQHISLFNMLSTTAGSMKYKKDFGSESTLIPDCDQQQPQTTTEDSGPGGTPNEPCGANNFQHNHHRHQRNNNSEKDNNGGGAVKGDDEEEDDEDDDDEVEADHETQTEYTLLSFSLWKDRLYEDWGFSLTDSIDGEDDGDEGNGSKVNGKKSTKISSKGEKSSPGESRHGSSSMSDAGSEILQIRPGGPAYAAGLLSGDRIVQINHQDVSHLESTMLVPILASLEDSLNLIVVRISGKTNS